MGVGLIDLANKDDKVQSDDTVSYHSTTVVLAAGFHRLTRCGVHDSHGTTAATTSR